MGSKGLIMGSKGLTMGNKWGLGIIFSFCEMNL